MRAIAVLSVVGYHAFPQWIPGGFVGVDVFFVISGYLITTILLTNLREKKYSFVNFYARRIKRIFPALIVILFFCMGLGWILLFDFEYEALGQQVAAGAAFVSNFLFWRESGYFAKAAETKPLLHLWSLAIEEQFYIFWPLFLFVIWRARVNVLMVLTLLLVATFALNVWAARTDPVADFYSPFTRFWELLTGAILAQLSLHPLPLGEISTNRVSRALHWLRSVNSPASHLRAAFGLALIIMAVFALNKKATFPGYWALLPAIGTYLIISAGRHAWPNMKLLSGRVPVWIGLISYPLYLWHWSLLSFASIIFGNSPAPRRAAALILVSLVLATLTFLLVERPIRSGQSTLRRLGPLVVLLAAVGIAGRYTVAKGGFPFRQANLEKIIQATTDWHPPVNNTIYRGVPAWSAGKALGNEMLFLGDSQMQQYFPRIQELTKNKLETAKRRVIVLTRTGCAPFPGIFREVDPPDSDTGLGCGKFNKRALSLTLSENIKVVVFAAIWSHYFSDPDFYVKINGVDTQLYQSKAAQNLVFEKFFSLLSELVASGKRVFVISEIPISDAFDPNEMIPVGWTRLYGLANIPRAPARSLFEGNQTKTRLEQVALQSGARLINPLDYLCSSNVCPVLTRNGSPRYFDRDHLNASFVRESVTYLDFLLH